MSEWWERFGGEIATVVIGLALRIIVPWAISLLTGIPMPPLV